MAQRDTDLPDVPLGVGFYTAPEAARLLGMPVLNVNRWLKGYAFRKDGNENRMPPLWQPQLATITDHLEIGFRDLVELRFVKAFVDAGVGLLAIRNCLDYARQLVADDRPFSTRKFKTDGQTIFLQSIAQAQPSEPQLLDLRKRQYVFGQVVERTFKDLDIEDDAVARWRPYKGKESIVIDPQRAFGQPVAAASGVPIIALAEAVDAEGSAEKVARLFEVAPSVVRDAVSYQASLQSAA